MSEALSNGAGTDEASTSSSTQQVPEKEKESLECPICLQTCIHPAKLPCGHIFCFLCIKGVVYKNRRCALCRREISPQFLDNPDLVSNDIDTSSNTEGYQWYYEGRNGWWQYDQRTSQDIEDAYIRGDKTCTILIAGYLYSIDFDAKIQHRQNDPTRRRHVKRDLATIPKKGVAGLRLDSTASTSTDYHHNGITNIISGIAVTDAAIRIASDIIDATLARTDEPINREQNDNHSDTTVGNNLIRRDLLEEVQETLNIADGSNSQGRNRPNVHNDIFTQTLNDFRTLTLNNVVSSDSENDDIDLLL